jgi:hypothetical protein
MSERIEFLIESILPKMTGSLQPPTSNIIAIFLALLDVSSINFGADFLPKQLNSLYSGTMMGENS